MSTYSPIHAEGIHLASLTIRALHIGALECAGHESHLIILKRSAPWFVAEDVGAPARGFEHMDFPEMCKLKCCESELGKNRN